jgi:trehalose-phosphatase
MQHLFQAWQRFAEDIQAASHVLLLSDYDGTLTPIVSRPQDAVLTPEVREKLGMLAGRPTVSVGIISGRSLSEIKSMVGIEGIYYAGNHGLEISGPGLDFVSPPAEAARAKINHLIHQLSAGLGGIKGILVEDKGLSLSVHYRLVKREDESLAAHIFSEITLPLLREGKIRITSGKKVWEVRPPINWHKGRAVEAIREELKALLKFERLPTIYLGDDTTDEDAFKVVRYPEGWSIFVGPENTQSSAEFFLNFTSEVLTFLSWLLELK